MGLSAWMTAASDTSQLQDGWIQIPFDQATNSGARMHYVKVGDGPPLILIHGLIGSAYSWRYNLQDLARTSTVYAVDLLGMGLSERIPGLDASISASADRMIAFMDALHLDKADIVGTSHGAALAMLLAARYPQRIGKLVLAAPANPYSKESNTLVHFYRTSIDKWLAPENSGPSHNLPHALHELAIGWLYNNSSLISTDTLENYASSLRVPFTREHIINALDSWNSDKLAISSAITALHHKPMLLIWGDHDRTVEIESGYAMQKLLPQAELIVLPGVGHLANEEMPEKFNYSVRNWLERHEVREVIREQEVPKVPHTSIKSRPSNRPQIRGFIGHKWA